MPLDKPYAGIPGTTIFDADGNIYFLAKIGATDGRSFQQMAGSMTGMSEQAYRDMMLGGGRPAHWTGSEEMR